MSRVKELCKMWESNATQNNPQSNKPQSNKTLPTQKQSSKKETQVRISQHLNTSTKPSSEDEPPAILSFKEAKRIMEERLSKLQSNQQFPIKPKTENKVRPPVQNEAINQPKIEQTETHQPQQQSIQSVKETKRLLEERLAAEKSKESPIKKSSGESNKYTPIVVLSPTPVKEHTGYQTGHPIKKEVHPVKEEVHPVHPIKEEVHPLKEEVHPLKEEVHPVKEEVHPVKEEVHPLKEEVHPVHPVKEEVHPVKEQVHQVKEQVHQVKEQVHPVPPVHLVHPVKEHVGYQTGHPTKEAIVSMEVKEQKKQRENVETVVEKPTGFKAIKEEMERKAKQGSIGLLGRPINNYVQVSHEPPKNLHEIKPPTVADEKEEPTVDLRSIKQRLQGALMRGPMTRPPKVEAEVVKENVQEVVKENVQEETQVTKTEIKMEVNMGVSLAKGSRNLGKFDDSD